MTGARAVYVLILQHARIPVLFNVSRRQVDWPASGHTDKAQRAPHCCTWVSAPLSPGQQLVDLIELSRLVILGVASVIKQHNNSLTMTVNKINYKSAHTPTVR